LSILERGNAKTVEILTPEDKGAREREKRGKEGVEESCVRENLTLEP
jgi:hypothetical protein